MPFLIKNRFFAFFLITGSFLYTWTLYTGEKTIHFSETSNLSACPSETAEEAVDSSSSWYREVTKKISETEYNIHYQDGSKAYESPNRANNLRITYHPGQVRMVTRNDSLEQENWKLELITRSLIFDGEEGYYPRTDAAVKTFGDTIEFKHGDLFTEQYINNNEGLRQNFIIHRAPKNNIRELRVNMQVSGELEAMQVHPTEVHFAQATGNGTWKNKIIYKDLRAWDATGNDLESEMQVENNELCLLINTSKAVFPITIDPISTTADAQLEANQANTYFGFVAGSAGDVNADGYSDVVVGAIQYDNGHAEEGRTFVYHGSATGVSTTAAITLENNVANSNMGNCAATAGDVNGDGYSDIIATAYRYTNGQSEEGAVYIYHGSASGITSTVQIRLESNQAGALYGVNAMCAGDVNADGYSDIIVGARLYTNTQNDEGAAFVYHGSASGITSTIRTQLECNQAGAEFGYSIAGAGDVNGDGYSDVIVGAKLYDNTQADEGAAFVYHGSAAGITTTVQTQLEVNQVSADFGRRVACAGDVNGDGYSDVIVGADFYDNGQSGEGAAFVYHGSATGITTTLRTQLECNQANAVFGFRVSGAGDVNGDGYADVIVGAELYDNGQADEGAAFVYHGSSTGITTTVQSQLEANQAGSDFGIGVGYAGDVNGDGYSDVIVGADLYTNGQSGEGAAFVYLGSPSGLNNTIGTQLERNQAGASMGWSVASAGDVNSDGYSDVIVGAPTYDNGQSNEGAAFIYHGSVTGLSTTVSTQLESNQVGGDMGKSVSSAGDVNGDRYSDVIVGADLYDNGQSDEGAAFVYHGSASGITTTIQSQLESNQASAQIATSVSSAGDVNRDGYSDVIVGGWAYDNGQSDEGVAFIYHGSASGINTTIRTQIELNQASAHLGSSVSYAGDVNGDGYSDVIVGADLYDNGQSNEGGAFIFHGSLSGITTTIQTRLESNLADASYGYSVSAAGDVNGDGYSDVIIGAYMYDNGQADEGSAFIYHGSSGGISSTIATRLEINQATAYFAFNVSSAGDVNGDGYSDVVVGAINYDNGQTNEGSIFVYHGSSSGITTTIRTRVESNQTEAHLGASVGPAGDVNGDGYSDIIAGADLYDNGQADEGGSFIYYGNNEEGKRNNLRIYNADLTTPITQANLASITFGAGLFAKSFLGRVDGKLVWEVKAQGVAFSTAGGELANSVTYTNQGSFTNLGITGTELISAVTKPAGESRIRVRVAYDKVTAITGQVYGPWIYSAAAQSGMIGMNSTPLPIELLSFDAKAQDQKVMINWKTATEINNDFFTVERSTDAKDWTFVANIKGAGNSNTALSYLIYDETPHAGVSYYRLKQTDFDGKYCYSHITSVQFKKQVLIQLFPNPATDHLSVFIKDQESDAVVEIYNTKGQKIASHLLQTLLTSGEKIQVESLTPGLYFVRIKEVNYPDYFFSSSFLKK